MAPDSSPPQSRLAARLLKTLIPLSLIFLLIEFFDELAYGAQGAALPLIRTELGLSYAQVGLLLGLPAVIGAVGEPVLLLLGDTRFRRRLILGGGLLMSLALALIAGSGSFALLLLALAVAYPSSGAFVSLSQATLMDLHPGRETKMMARWTLSGSLANVLGPLLAGAGFALGLGWRWIYVFLAIFGLTMVGALLPRSLPQQIAERPGSFGALLHNLKQTVRKPGMIRWMLLLQMSDLMLDVFVGYVALYFTDVVGAGPALASLALGILMVSGLAADAILIPLLERFPGRTIVRVSSTVAAILYIAWLAAPWPAAKYALLVLVGISRLGWYSVLKGEAYAAAPGHSGAVNALSSLARLLGGALSWLTGWMAASAGLSIAMAFLLVGPLALILFIPPSVKKIRIDTSRMHP